MGSISKSQIDNIFGKILKEFRMKNNLTQEKLSEKLGISLKYISRIENGNSGVKTQTLINYMNILSITPNMIYSEFITNEKIKNQVELCVKINNLSDEKMAFISSMVDLLQNMK